MQANETLLVAPDRMLPLRLRSATRLTDDELFDFCARNPSLRVERTPSGEILIASPTGAQTGRRNFQLIVQIGAWAAKDGTGIEFDSSAGFLLPNGAERAPDASWLARHRWEALSPKGRTKFAPLCPDFVVELRSPSDDLAELQAKMDEYIACGAKLGWLLDVDAKRAWVYRPGVPVEALDGVDELTGGAEMPGLVVSLAALDR